jgi:hypothetical protein
MTSMLRYHTTRDQALGVNGRELFLPLSIPTQCIEGHASAFFVARCALPHFQVSGEVSQGDRERLAIAERCHAISAGLRWDRERIDCGSVTYSANLYPGPVRDRLSQSQLLVVDVWRSR